jgi:hypothetical protein
VRRSSFSWATEHVKFVAVLVLLKCVLWHGNLRHLPRCGNPVRDNSVLNFNLVDLQLDFKNK